MKRFAYLDIEATHTNWRDAEIIEIAFIIKDENGKDLDHFQSLVRPKAGIEKEITELTGITTNMVNNAPEFFNLAPRISQKLEDTIIVAHKAEFDYEILKKALAKLDIEFKNKSICTLNLSQKLIPEMRSYSLVSLCDLFQIKLKKNHRALEDAIALSELHTHLRLLNGELKERKEFLPSHKKLIEKAPNLPGIIKISYAKKNELFKTENIKKRLSELLLIQSTNRERISKSLRIDYSKSATLIGAGLMEIQIQKPFYPFCIYQVKTQSGRIILKIGKTDPKRKALFYTKTKNEAQNIIDSMVKKVTKTKYAYKDPNLIDTEVKKQNLDLQNEISKLVATSKNYLIRSADLVDGKYHYIIIKGNKSYAKFQTEKEITKSTELNLKNIKLKNIGPREFMSINHSLKWIKNQKVKTDKILEIKIK